MMVLPPNAHLLRTLAAVPYQSRILELGCGLGRHTIPLVQLGFETYACDLVPQVSEIQAQLAALDLTQTPHFHSISVPLPFEEEYFDWAVLYRTYDDLKDGLALQNTLREARRVMRTGAWIYVAFLGTQAQVQTNGTPQPIRFTREGLTAFMETIPFALAEAPHAEKEGDDLVWCGIYRKVNEETIR